MPKRTSGDLVLDSTNARWRRARKPHGRAAIVSRLAAMLMGLVLLAAYTPVVASAAVPRDQTITFGAAPTGAVIGSIGVSVSATATSNQPVTYSSTTSSVCSVDASTGSLVLTAAGTCTIAADQAGDGSWNAAPQVTQDVAIGVTISGTITGPDGTTAVSGATLQVCAATDGSSCSWPSTDASGAYTTGAFVDGSYVIRVNAPSGSSLADGWYDSAAAPSNWTADYTAATPVTISGADITGIDVTLPQGHTISGTITDSAGNPVSGAQVTALGIDVPAASTGVDGTYTTSPLPVGSYNIMIIPPAGSSLVLYNYYDGTATTGHWTADLSAATPVTLGGADVMGIDVALPTGHTISGTVVGSDGATPSSLQVNVCTVDGSSCPYSVGTSDGTFTTAYVPDGDYTISVMQPGSEPYQGGWYLTGAPGNLEPSNDVAPTAITLPGPGGDVAGIAMVLPRLYVISGRVIDADGANVSGATVGFWFGACWPLGGPCGFGSIDATTDAAGAYVTPPVLPGSYFAQVTPPSGSPAMGGFFGPDPSTHYGAPGSGALTFIALTNADLALPTMTLPVGVRIGGNVTGPSGEPLAGVMVTSEDQNWIATTDSSGDYLTSGILPNAGNRIGFDTINVSPPSSLSRTITPLSTTESAPPYASGWFGPDPTSHFTIFWGEARIALGSSDLTGVDVVIPRAHSIFGSATLSDGRPVATPLGLLPPPGGACSGWGSIGNDYDGTTGAFWMSGIPDGEYRLALYGGYYSTSAPGHFTLDSAQASLVTVLGGDVTVPPITVPLGTSSGNTTTGLCVAVSPLVSSSASTPASITYDSVTAPGTTSVTVNGASTASSWIVNIDTTATFDGTALVCISYQGVSLAAGTNPRLYHFTGGTWVDITSAIDSIHQKVCGPTSSFSPFAVSGQGTSIPTPAGGGSPVPGRGGSPRLSAQTITFTLPPTGLASTTVGLSATASSSLPVSYALTTPAVCTVSGATLSLLTAGACSVTATQPGDGVTWTAATPVSASITVLTSSPAKARSALRLLGRLNLVGLTVSRLTLSTHPKAVIVERISASWGLKGTTIELWTRTAGGTWHKLTTRVLDATGHASVKLAATRSATYRWRFGGTSVYFPTWSNSVTLTVR